MFLDEFDEEKMKRQEREEGIEEERAKEQKALKETLQFFIKSGKLCKEDAEEFKSFFGERLQDYEIV